MQVRFTIPDLDNPHARELDESFGREISFLPRVHERVVLCPPGEDRGRDFVVVNVFHHTDLNTVQVILGIPAWEQSLRRVVAEGDEDVSVDDGS